MLCCRCGRTIGKSAVPPSMNPLGPTCAQRLGLLPEPDLLKRRRAAAGKRKAREDERQLRFAL